MDSKTIAQVKAEGPQSLWDFLSQLPGTMDAQIWYGLLLGGLIGMALHYAIKMRTGEVGGNPIDYFIKTSPWRTIGALAAMASWAFGEVLTGIYVNGDGIFIGWAAVLISGIKNGYLGDSIINKGERAVWTEQQRQDVAAAADPPKP